MDAPVDAAALPLPDSGVDAAAPGEDAAPAVRTFAMGARIAWAEEEEDDEPMTEERKRQYDEIVGKYKSRGERFGTGDGAPKKSPSLLDAPLGAKPRLSRLEVMQQRRERQGVTGFATGFDVLSPEEQRKRAERAARYGSSLEGGGGGKAVEGGELAGDPAGALVVDVLEPRRDALGDAVVRHECVYVYGVDHLSTKECMSYFGDYAPVFVEWINDSSCNVVFADAFTAKRAMYGKGVHETTTPATEAPDAGAPAAADEAPMEGDAPAAPIAPEEDGAGGDAVMTTGSGPHPECFFFKGADFVKPGGIRVPLTFRLATTDDVKPDGKVTSRYLWCGGKRPGPPPKRSQNSGRKRRRREDEGGDEEAVEAEAVPDIDLREALKKRRELAAGEAGAMETGEEGKAEEGVEAAAAVEAATVPLVLPPGDLRAKLAAAAAPEVVEDPIPVDAE